MSQRDSSSAVGPAHAHAARRDWPGYFRAVAGRPPRETLLRALDLFEADAPSDAGIPPLAVDLGCGEGRDTAELLRRGWRVLAVDGHPDALDLTRRRGDLPADAEARLRTRLEPLEAFRPPPCRLVNASFTLPFCEPAAFDGLWDRLVAAIEPGGRFAGQFFGDRDSWAALPDRSHHARDRVEALLAPFEIEHFDEDEKPGETTEGHAKHWHVFHIVARKRGDRVPKTHERDARTGGQPR